MKAIEILESENIDLIEEEFNVALNIIKKHTVVFMTLSASCQST